MNLRGPRHGLLRVVGGKPFHLGSLPALPPDVVSWSALNLDLVALYDTLLPAIEHVAALVAPQELPQLKESLRPVDRALGVSLREDLLGSLENQLLHYSSPSEGVLLFGETFLFKVRDTKRLQASLEQGVKALVQLAGAKLRLKRTRYRGVTLHQVYIRQQGVFFVPTFAIHQDWLVVGFFPQAVQGFILRTAGQKRCTDESQVLSAVMTATVHACGAQVGPLPQGAR